jgi:ABC-type sugar transport system substrate-binding protein
MTEPEQLEGTEGESQITRRTFLQGGLAVAGSMAVAPSVLRSHSGFRLPMATPGKAQPTPTTLSSYKPFNPHVPAGPPTGLPKRIATNFPSGSAYFQQFADNVRLAVESRGYHFTSTTYGSDVAQNVNAINELVNSGIGAVILQVQDEQGQAPTVQKLIDQGIYVIYSVAGPCDTQVIADQYQCGYVQGINAAKWVTQHMGGQAQVCVFNASQISPFFIPRAQGRIDGVKKAGKGVQIVANEPIKLLTPEEGQQLAASVLQAHPGVNVWLGDDDTVIGVVAALQQAGKKGTDKIFVSGFNGQANALAAVKAGVRGP